MKIDTSALKSHSGSASPTGSAAGKGVAEEFKGVLKTARTEDFNGSMKELVGLVRERGEQFIKSPQEDSLESYKDSVRNFLKRIKEEYLSLKEEFGTQMNGEQKLYQLVETSEAEVKNLTREALTENKALDLLSSLDDIRGLVLDIIG